MRVGFYNGIFSRRCEMGFIGCVRWGDGGWVVFWCCLGGCWGGREMGDGGLGLGIGLYHFGMDYIWRDKSQWV